MGNTIFKIRPLSVAISAALVLSGTASIAAVSPSGQSLSKGNTVNASSLLGDNLLSNVVPLYQMGTDKTGQGGASTPSLGSGLNMKAGGLGLRPVFAGSIGQGKTLVLFQDDKGQFFASVIPLLSDAQLLPPSSSATASSLPSASTSGQGLSLAQSTPSSEAQSSNAVASGNSAESAIESSSSKNGFSSESGSSDSTAASAPTNVSSVQPSASTAGNGSASGQRENQQSLQAGNSYSGASQASPSGSPANGASTSASTLAANNSASSNDGSARQGTPDSASTGGTASVASGQSSSDEPAALTQAAAASTSRPASSTYMGVTEGPADDNIGSSGSSASQTSSSVAESNESASSSSETSTPASTSSSSGTSSMPSYSAGSAYSESGGSSSRKPDYAGSNYTTKPIERPSSTLGQSGHESSGNGGSSGSSHAGTSGGSSGSSASGNSLTPSTGFLSGVGSVGGSSSSSADSGATGMSSTASSILDNMHNTLNQADEQNTSFLQDRAENYGNYSSADPSVDVVCASPAAMIRNQGEGDGYLANVNPSWTWSHAGHANSALGGWEHWSKDEQARLPQFKGLSGSWQRLMPWFVISRVAGSNVPADIEIGRMSVFWFNKDDQQWHLLAFDMKAEIGVCGPQDTGMVNCRSPGTEPRATTGTSNALHGWFEFVEVPDTAQAISVAVQARLLKGGPALMTAAADYYPPGQSNLKGVPITGAGGSAPRRLKDNGDWTVVTMTTLADQTVDDTGISRDLLMKRAPGCANPVADR